MEIHDRIKFLRRNHLKLTQEEFATKISVSRANLGSIEVGRINVTERVIADICREFNASYAWLKTGEGEMFDTSNDDTTALFDRIMASDNETAKKLFRAFAKLDEDEWKVIEKIIDEVAKK